MTTETQKTDQDPSLKGEDQSTDKTESHWTRVCRENPGYIGCKLYEI